MRKKLLSVLLALAMVLTLLPVAAFAAEGEEVAPLAGSVLANIAAISTGGVVDGDATAKTTVTFGDGAVLYYAGADAGAGTGRNEGYHVGVRVTLPAGADTANIKYQKVEQWWYDTGSTVNEVGGANPCWVTKDYSAAHAGDADGEITLWGLAQPTYFGQFGNTESGNLYYRYRFDWDGNNTWDQEILVIVEPSAKLMAGSDVVWPVETVTVPNSGEVNEIQANQTIEEAKKEDGVATFDATESTATEVKIPVSAIEAAVSNEVSVAVAAKIDGKTATVTLDSEALSSITAAEGTVSISISQAADAEQPDPTEGEVVASYKVEVKVDDTPVETWDTNSKITLTVPKPDGIAIASSLKVYLDNELCPTATVRGNGDNIDITVPHLTVVSVVSEASAEVTVASAAELKAALEQEGVTTVTVSEDITLNENITIPEDVTLIIPADVTVTTAAGVGEVMPTIANNGTLKIDGTLTTGEETPVKVVGTGTVEVTGEAVIDTESETATLRKVVFTLNNETGANAAELKTFTVYVGKDSVLKYAQIKDLVGANPTKDGYTFAYWQSAGNRVTDNTEFSADIVVLAAVWNQNSTPVYPGGSTIGGNRPSRPSSSSNTPKPGTTTPTQPSDPQPTTPAITFNDVSASSWYATAVDYVVAKGMMNGTGNGAFSPNGTANRAMIMTILARYAGENTDGGATWYEKGMAWSVANGVSDGSNPMGLVTREQLVTMLWRYAGEPASEGDLSVFPDAANTHDWAVSAMQWAVSNGIIEGSNGNLNPAGNATRAQVATILMRFCQLIEQ